MTKRKRTRFTSEEKASAVIRHLQDGVPVSDICDELGTHPNNFYNWQKQFLANAASAFERHDNITEKKLEQKISVLEDKMTVKNDAISELLAEHIALKKSLGVI